MNLKIKFLRKFSFIILFVLISINCFSQYWIYRDESELRNSISVGLIGIHTTSIYINYGRMIVPKHEIVCGIPIIRSKRQPEIGFFCNYRFHFNENINTFFVGAFINYSKVDGIVHETQSINGISISAQDYTYVSRIFTVGPNLGKKWVMPSGFCYTAKIGYGLCNLKTKWDKEFNDQDFIKSSEKITKIIGSIDLELTIGFAFNLKQK